MYEQVKGHPLFAQVDPTLLRQVLSGAEEICASRGETLYDRQRFRRCLGIVMEGTLTVRKESLLVSALRAGDLFGAAALFNREEDYPTTLTAQTDCRILLISQEGIRELLQNSGIFAENYVSYLSGRIRFLSHRLDALSADGGEGKLARYLLSGADETGAVTMSATQLSQRLGIGRATLYRAFEMLERGGMICREGKTIRILDETQLHALCEHA